MQLNSDYLLQSNVRSTLHKNMRETYVKLNHEKCKFDLQACTLPKLPRNSLVIMSTVFRIGLCPCSFFALTFVFKISSRETRTVNRETEIKLYKLSYNLCE